MALIQKDDCKSVESVLCILFVYFLLTKILELRTKKPIRFDRNDKSEKIGSLVTQYSFICSKVKFINNIL